MDDQAFRMSLNGLVPNTRQIDDAAMSYRHDFGLLDEREKAKIRFAAREWLRAWQKTV